MDSMEKFLTDKATDSGLPLPIRPTVEPEMPRDLTSVSGKDLSSLMNDFASLMAWAGYKAAVAGGVAAAKRAKFKYLRSKEFITIRANSTTKITDKTLENLLDSNEELWKIKGEEVSAEQFKILADSLYEGYSSKASVLSRELTRRGMKGSIEF